MIKSKSSEEISAQEIKSSDSFSQVFMNLLNHELRGNTKIPNTASISLNVDQLSLVKLIEGDE